MNVCAICVNYNNSHHTIAYIDSLLPHLGKYLKKVVIVDNNSTHDDIINIINHSRIDDRVLVQNEKNIGYFPALNSGIACINVNDFDYIVIGNNDLTFDNNFFIKLNACNYSNDVFVIAPNIIKHDGVHQNPHITKKFNKLQNLYRRIYFTHYYVAIVISGLYNLLRKYLYPQDRINNNIEHEILMGYGACYILTRNFFNHYEFLDAPVFLMGEEGILANQVLEKNGKTIYNPNVIVYHHDHASIGRVSSKKLYHFSKISYKHYLAKLKNLH